MKLKNLYIFTILLSINLSGVYGNTNILKSSVTGQVIDSKTKQPLPFANIIIKNTTMGAAADENGYFKIRGIMPGKVRLVATMMGYKRAKKMLSLKPGQRTVINFMLDPAVLEMGAIVVTGTSTPHILEDVPVRTEVIPRRVIERKQANNLAEALSFQTGVRVENNCTNCNFTQVRILGMPGKYSQILIDGDPVISSLAGVYGLEHFPEEMVDQIEIVKGGGSALYGGGAIAGVINMITRRPMTNQIRIKYLQHNTGGKPDTHIGVIAEKACRSGKSGVYIFGSFRQRTPYDFNGDGFSELGELTNESIGFKWFYKPLNNSELITSFHHIHEERRGGNKFDLPVHEADIAEWIEHWRSGGTIRWAHRIGPLFDYRAYYSFSLENRKSYYGGLDGDAPEERLAALAFYGKADNPLHITGFQANYHISNHLITFGSQYFHNKLTDKTSAQTAYHVNAIYTNTGIFLQDDMNFGKHDEFEIVYGVRFDKHSQLTKYVTSPRVNGRIKVTKDLKFRAAYTTGFKPPQIFDEDLHLCGIEGDQRIIRNSPQLKAENSYSIISGFDFSRRFTNCSVMLSFSGFFTRLDNSFSQKFVKKQGNTELWERINTDGAKVKGVELDFAISPMSTMEIRGGLTYKKSRYDSVNEDFNTKDYMRTPDLSGNLKFNFLIGKNSDIFIAGNYTGKAYMPHEKAVDGQDDPELVLEKSTDFLQVDIGCSFNLRSNSRRSTKLNFGIKNMTNAYQRDLDMGADRDPAYTYGPIRPRTFYAGTEIIF
ncbi:TonB-dependent receptor [bacterium]|nr:TonB-dependent receptor [bacterium]